MGGPTRAAVLSRAEERAASTRKWGARQRSPKKRETDHKSGKDKEIHAPTTRNEIAGDDDDEEIQGQIGLNPLESYDGQKYICP